jgi:hypothetical protein
MPTHEIVDLVSSDDDCSLLPPVRKNIAKNAPSSKPTTSGPSKHDAGSSKVTLEGFLDLSSDLDLPIPPYAQVHKRRRLSPPEGTQHGENSKCGKFNSESAVKVKPQKQVVDDITFTSSPKEIAPKRHPVWTALSSDGSSIDDLPDWVGKVPKEKELSIKTAALLAEIIGNDSKSRKSEKGKGKEPEEFRSKDAKEQEKHASNKERRLKASDTEEAKKLKALEQAQKKAEKILQKEVEKEAKRQERELRAQEKQRAADIAEVNKSKLNKDITTPEMIVQLPTSMDGSHAGNQTREFLRLAKAEVSTYVSNIPGIIKWRRKIRADFDEEAGHWVPVPQRIDDEKFVLCYLSAIEFCKLVTPISDDDQTIEVHLSLIRNTYPGYKLIYLIEGLEKLIAKNKNASNRAYVAAVRSLVDQEQQSSTRRRKQDDYVVDEHAIEDRLLDLQLVHKCLVHQSSDSKETAETIASFTQQISLKPYKFVFLLSKFIFPY